MIADILSTKCYLDDFVDDFGVKGYIKHTAFLKMI